MPVAPTYPGVYIEEVPSGVRTITGVSTSIAAFVDSFERGPLDTPVRVLGFPDFQREYGGLRKTSPASYGISQFFLNGGQQAYVVRVASGAFATASVVVRNDNGDDLFRAFAGQRVGGVSRQNPGNWGNAIRLEFDYNTGNPADVFSGQEAAIITPEELFNLTVLHTARDGGRLVVLNTETFRNLTMRPEVSRNAIEVVNESSRLIQLDREGLPGLPADPIPPPALGGTLGGNLPAPAAIPADSSSFDVSVGGISRTATLAYGGAAPTTYAELRPFLQAAIRAAGETPTPVPMLTGATVELVDIGAEQRIRVLAGRSGTDFTSDATITFANDGADSTAADLGLVAADVNVQLYALGATNDEGSQRADTASGFGQGADGDPADATALRGIQDDKTGMHALRDVDLFNILCIPRAAAADFTETQTQAVYSEAITLCNEERAFLLIDIPEAVNSIDAMETWITDNATLRDKNAAMYFPRVRFADQLDDFRLKNFAPSGTIAGLMARTDSNRGVWKAPAGTQANLRGVSSLQVLMDDRENGVLNPQAVNALRVFPNAIVSWGARTLVGFNNSGQDDHRYVPVRRVTLFLEESLYRGLRFAVFEPNDEPLWAQIRLAAGAFMNNLFRQGAFQGQKASNAYFVKCDAETTTQNDINLGIVNVLVGFAPLRPAEFVIIRIQQLAGQIQT
ncbi:MAG: phage tail sheath subtilisin-like domain-containing protein [Gammaproteobacteria bacterium]|nr:phage tail sheath subtilisin-like domain-containing protein [Gammaproteobacteria bacterium]MDJ0892082.1 phage tail sheath subtilisin-like domain-containing protein [Gammaproteobacteria bacterium]